MFKVTYKGTKTTKDTKGKEETKTGTIASTLVDAEDAGAALKKAHDLLKGRKPEERARVTEIRIQKQEEGALKWD